MSLEGLDRPANANPRLCMWVFQQRGAIVGVPAESEEAATQLLLAGAASAIPLKPLQQIATPWGERAVVALGVIDRATTLLGDYWPHDQGLVTLADRTGRTWAFKPNPRVL